MQRLAIALMALTLVWGCKDDSESSRTGDSGANSSGGGGSGSGSDGGTRAELPGDKPLGDLSESETMDLCEQLRETTDSEDAKHGTCAIAASVAVDFAKSGGGTDEEVRAECDKQLADCLAEAPKPCQPITFTDACEATVDDFAACSKIATQQLTELADRSCEDIIEQSGADAGADAGDGGMGITSGLADELARCSAMLNACTSGG
jgi:hypothetical protein